MIRSIILNHIHRYKCMLFDQYVRNGRDVSIIVREDNVHRAGGCRLDGSKQPGLRQGESSRGEEDGFRADQRFTYPHSIRQRGISRRRGSIIPLRSDAVIRIRRQYLFTFGSFEISLREQISRLSTYNFIRIIYRNIWFFFNIKLIY